jgi:hypothetical protein
VKAAVTPLPFVAMVTISEGGAQGEIEMISGARESHAKLQDCCLRTSGVYQRLECEKESEKIKVEGYQFVLGGMRRNTFSVLSESGLLSPSH